MWRNVPPPCTTCCVFSVFLARLRWLRRFCSRAPKLAGGAAPYPQSCHAAGKAMPCAELRSNLGRLDLVLSELEIPSFEQRSHFYGDFWLLSDLILGSKHSDFPIRVCSATAQLLFFSLAVKLEVVTSDEDSLWSWQFAPFLQETQQRFAPLSPHRLTRTFLAAFTLKYLSRRIKPLPPPPNKPTHNRRGKKLSLQWSDGGKELIC